MSQAGLPSRSSPLHARYPPGTSLRRRSPSPRPACSCPEGENLGQPRFQGIAVGKRESETVVFMALLITGGAGYIGSQMVHELVDAGERVVVLDDLSTGFRWAVPEGAPLVIGETGDQALVARLIRDHEVDSIIHFAASIVVPDSVRDPLAYYRNNTVNSRALIETAVKSGVRRFIFSSTAAVYGNPARVPVQEDDPTVPMSPYGWSKLMTEIMLRDAGTAHGLRYAI